MSLREGRPETGTPVGKWTVADEAGMLALGEELARRVGRDGCLLLVGDLGSGKTTLTKGVARTLGIPSEQVLSPTYTLINEYSGDVDQTSAPRSAEAGLVHADLYRLELEDLFELGLDEILASPGVKVVEWAERLVDAPEDALWVHLQINEDGSRLVCAYAAT